jgi:proline iminopeptidase
MIELHPPIQRFRQGYLDVGQGHSLYYELSGNPEGIPVLFIHGGPGAGLPSNYSQFFNSEDYLIIGFEQRGCGRSTPFATLSCNTTQHLVADITRLRQALKIEKWLIFGGSWGATLALLAVIDAPHTCLGLILRGVFLARKEDIEWFLAPTGGAANLFPEQYKNFTSELADKHTYQHILNNYYAALMQRDINARGLAAQRWFCWEDALSGMNPRKQDDYGYSSAPMALIRSLALFECYFLKNRCFIEENYILANIGNINHLPCSIVHGRYDIVCQPSAAYALHQAWPKSRLNMVPMAGHSTSDTAIAKALTQEAAHMAGLLSSLGTI